MRIFLDVGAHTGETLVAVIDLDFAWIYCFEPASSCWNGLMSVANGNMKIFIEPFGLWNKACTQLIYDAGEQGGSLWPEKARHRFTEMCHFRRASAWFAENLKDGATVFMKLNCEGAECDILDDLLDSGEFRKVSFLLVDFDVRKIPSQRYREAELRARLAEFSFPRVAYTKQVMKGATHQERIKNWIKTCNSL